MQNSAAPAFSIDAEEGVHATLRLLARERSGSSPTENVMGERHTPVPAADRRRLATKSSPLGPAPRPHRPGRKAAVPELVYCVIARTAGATLVGWLSQPTRQPVIAQALEKPLTQRTRSSSSAIASIDGRRLSLEVEPVVDLVGDDPDAGPAAERQQRLTISSRAGGPAGRVRRCREDDRPGSRVAEIEEPRRDRAARCRRGGRARRDGPRPHVQVGSHGGCWAIAARCRRRCRRSGATVRGPGTAPACHRALRSTGPCRSTGRATCGLIVRQCRCKVGPAAHFGHVEGFARVEARLGRIADELRRDEVAFTVPERDHALRASAPSRRAARCSRSPDRRPVRVCLANAVSASQHRTLHCVLLRQRMVLQMSLRSRRTRWSSTRRRASCPCRPSTPPREVCAAIRRRPRRPFEHWQCADSTRSNFDRPRACGCRCSP